MTGCLICGDEQTDPWAITTTSDGDIGSINECCTCIARKISDTVDDMEAKYAHLA